MSSTRLTAAFAALAVAAGALVAPAPVTAGPPAAFDLQAHRGGLGLRPESTLAAFGYALRLGVSTLELDVQITADGHAVVTHDRRVDGRKCDTEHAGRYVKDLTLAQPRVADPDWYRRQDPAYFHGPAVPVLQRRYGLTVVPYTINDAAVMQRLIDLGVDGLISDDPDLAILVARRNGLR